MDDNILVIGIAGGTGSGKTTLMNNLISRFEGMVTVISHDNYYKRHDDMTYEERSQLNYDEPAAFDTSLMVFIWKNCAGDTPSNARCTTSPSITGRSRPFTSCRKRSSSWRAF